MERDARIAALEEEVAALKACLAGTQAPASSEERLDRLLGDRRLLDSLEVVVTVLDRDHRILYLNRTAPGRTVAELIGTSALAHMPEEQHAAYVATVERAWDTGTTQSLELRTHSGRWWESRFYPVREGGQVVCVMTTTMDVTEQKRIASALDESRTRMRHAVEASGMGLWEWDCRTDAITWDETMCRIFGVGRDAVPRTSGDFLGRLASDDRERVRAAVMRCRQTGLLEHLEYRVTRPDGEVRHVVASAVAHRDANGRVSAFHGGMFDISDRRRLEAQLANVQKMEAIGQLTAGIAHNFNNLLGVIVPNVELLRIERDASRTEARLDDIEDAALRAAEMVRQLLLFARTDRTVAKRPFDLVALSRRVVDICRTTFDRRIAVDLESDASAIGAFGNANQIEQVVLNVCLNARDALELGATSSPRIALRVRASGDEAILEVSDDGPGMDETTRLRIFEPFFTTKEVGRGTGLGLATAYAILSEHGGRIACESAPGRGATFTITLPGADLDALAPAGLRSTLDRRGSETILVVDDEAAVRRAIGAVLVAAGFAVVEASDGVAGLEAITSRRVPIDAVLVDRSMPKMSGEQLLAELAKLERPLPVVLLSGDPGTLGSASRAAAVLSKPVDSRTLVEALRSVIDARDGLPATTFRP